MAPGDESPFDDRLNGPGWNDRLPGHDEPYQGETGIRRLGREGDVTAHYYGQLVKVMRIYHAQSLRTMAGNFGSFYLRFTREESEALLESARLAEVVDRLDGRKDPNVDIHLDDRWKPTDAGRKIPPPLVGSARTQLKTYLALAWAMVKDLHTVLPYLVFVFGLSGAVSIAKGSTAAQVIAVLTALGVSAYLMRARSQSDRRLTAAALAWPRLATYRPARYRWETEARKTPWARPMLAAATTVAGAVIFAILRHAHAPPLSWWPELRVSALPLLVVTVAIAAYRYWRGEDLRRPVRAEKTAVMAARKARRPDRADPKRAVAS
jgi:hypothetical protein